MSYELIQAPSFWDCLRSMRRDDSYKAALLESLVELHEQPFKNPKLQTHDIGKDRRGRTLFSSDVGGRRSDRRLVWQVFNKTVVVLLYGTHAVQERARRMRVAFDPAERVVTILETAPDTGVERPYQHQRAEVGRLFMAWTDDDLAGFGFPQPTIAVLRSLDSDEELLALEASLGAVRFEAAFNLVAFGNVDGELALLSAAAEAIASYQTLGDTAGLSNAYLNLGLALHLNLERLREAEEAYRVALRLAEAGKVDLEESISIYERGEKLKT